MRFFPVKRLQDSSAAKISLIQRILSVHSTDRIFPLGGINTDMPTGSFSAILWESKPAAVGFLPLGVPTTLQGILPLRAPIWCSTDGMPCPPQSTNTSLRALLIWTCGRMNPLQFSSMVPSIFRDEISPTRECHIPMRGIPLLGSFNILMMGFPHSKASPLWDFSHTEVNSIVVLIPT